MSTGCKTCGGTGKVVERPVPPVTFICAPSQMFDLLPFGHPDAELDGEVWLCPDCWFLDPPGGES